MKFFNNHKNKIGIKANLSSDFRNHVNRSISLLSMNDGSLEDEDVLKILQINGISQEDATEIFLFLPIAFVRQLLPNLNWPDKYIERINHQLNEIRYIETESFIIIWEETLKYFSNNPDSETIIKIAGRSAEFQAINRFLLENPNRKIEEVKLTNTVIVR